MLRKTVLALALCVCVCSWADKKKGKAPEVDLATWAQEEAARLPEEVDGVKIFRPNSMDKDNKARVTGFVDLPGVSRDQAFIAAYIFANESLDPETDEVETVDFENKRFVIYREVADGEGKNAMVYRYTTAYQFTDNMMTFASYDINIEYKEKGIIPRKLNIEKFKPAANERHKEIVESFALSNSRDIDGMARYARENTKLKVTHWADIKAGKVVKGMNEAEVRLIGGSPRSINPSGNRTQWMFSNDFIVIFTDGIVTNVIQ